MPGQARCFKCGSILEGEAGILDIHPPRMPSWKRPWRHLSRRLRRRSPLAGAVESKIPTQWAAENADIIWGIILSIVPGFAHLLRGRFRRILWVWCLWLAFFGLNALLFQTAWGWRFLGVAAAIHAWMAVDVDLRAQLDQALERVLALLIAFVCFMVFYVVLAQVCPPGMEFVRTPLSIPSADVQKGDTLLLRPLTDESQALTRGALVGFRARAIGRGATLEAIGQVVGLPSETVVINQGVYSVNGTALPRDAYPVLAWFPTQRVELKVGPNQYFISSEYRRVRGRRRAGRDIVKRLCLVDKEAVESQATMLWWPLNRRHRLNTRD